MKSRKLIFLFVAAMMLALTYVPAASAGGKTIWENPENPCNKVSFSGDMRYRYETSSTSDASVSEDRDRQRIRVRLGFKVQTGHGATAGVRLATVPTANDTQNQTLEGTDQQSALGNFGVDRAYIHWAHGSGFWVIGGKFGNPAKQFANAWTNGSFNAEGIGFGYGAAVGDGKIKLVLAQLMMKEKDYDDEGDEKGLLMALHWGGKIGDDLKLDVAVNNLAIDRTAPGAPDPHDDTYTHMLIGAKWNQISGGVEIMSSNNKTDGANDESSDTAAMVVHLRYKISKTLGIRVYMYDIGSSSVPVPPTEFVVKKNNFTGTRVQLDVKAAGINMDFRWLSQKVKNDKLTTWDDATTMQANFVVGF